MTQSSLMVTEEFGKVLEGVISTFVSSDFPSSKKLNYWRSKSGAEVDFILSDGEPIAKNTGRIWTKTLPISSSD